jgi:hypothetical protein
MQAAPADGLVLTSDLEEVEVVGVELAVTSASLDDSTLMPFSSLNFVISISCYLDISAASCLSACFTLPGSVARLVFHTLPASLEVSRYNGVVCCQLAQ